MVLKNFSFISHEYIDYVLNKKNYLYALILIDSYLDHYAAWCYRTYYRANKSKLKKYFQLKFLHGGKRNWSNLIKNLPPAIFETKYSKKYRYKSLFDDIQKFRHKRNTLVHNVMGLQKLFSKHITVVDSLDFDKRYKKDRECFKKLKPLILEGIKIVNRIAHLQEDMKFQFPLST